jgi:GDPmannose 4,6-dehydratase
MGLLNVLETVRQDFPRCKVYQASTSELFGKALETPQNENTPFNPISPYAVAKLSAHNTAKYYRDYYGIFVSCGILFNHESPRRGEEFLTQKVIQAVKNIKAGKQKELILGDLSPKRDWGYAPEYIEAMHDMLCHNTPDDFVIATGEANSVRDFVRYAFKLGGLGNYKQYVTENVDKRPAEVFTLCGDSTKALDKLGWKAKTTMKDLIKIMLEQDPDENVWEWR